LIECQCCGGIRFRRYIESLSGTIPLTATFTNLSIPTQVITSALWAYGDGVISNTLALTHTHTYTRAGVYTVTLSVSDGVVTDTLTRTNYITATGGTVYTTTTHVITYTYECAASLKRSERDKLYRLTGADYSTGEAFAYGYDPVGNPVSAYASRDRLPHRPHPHPDRHHRHHLRL
jgi:PKD repeat protein